MGRRSERVPEKSVGGTDREPLDVINRGPGGGVDVGVGMETPAIKGGGAEQENEHSEHSEHSEACNRKLTKKNKNLSYSL